MEDYAPLIERAFSLEVVEQSYAIEEIEGEVPAFVRGTYYLNGPARFARGGLRYRHWLDGDGMVCALHFDGRQVRFTNRFVRSEKFSAEEEAGRPLFRTFGTTFPSARLKRRIALEPSINVSVYPYRQTLLTFGEQGLPWELDAVTLDTRGKFDFGGCLNEVSPFAAHPKFDHATGEMFNFGVAFSNTEPRLHLYRFSGQARQIYRRRLSLEYACSVHDFSLSPSYAIFYLSPYLLDMAAFVRDGRTLLDSLRWESARGSLLLIASRETGHRVATIPVGSRYCLHLINSFEEGGLLMVDILELDQPIYDQYQNVPDLFMNICEGRPVRLVVDVENLELVRRQEINYRLAPDFPSIDPRCAARPYKDFWMLGISSAGRYGRKFFDDLVHADWDAAEQRDIYRAPPLNYLGGEPVFVGDPNHERSGVVICQVFDALRRRSAFAVFNAFDVAAGPLAWLWLNAPICLGFHTSFAYPGWRGEGA
jgi:all-trans-8'-apo-beta-carotenal 15,15'-oxygenase